MEFRRILREVRDLNLYVPEQWDEYVGYFEGSEELKRYLGGQPSEATGQIRRRIETGRGSKPAAANFDISPKIVCCDALAQPGAREGMTLGVVSGAFDLLHLGHIRGMIHAKHLLRQCTGPRLCAMTLSDENIRAKKGASRPVLNVNERLDMLAHLECVDYVVPLEEPDGLIALDRLNPDYFFKASRDRAQEIVLREMALVESKGGSVVVMPPEVAGGTSTTELIGTILGR